ncbi:MAG: hypothetical protein MR209_01585 [Veillonellaceae bacterium]|nr:hypothetical protein [Veillonellaceae bacterium]
MNGMVGIPELIRLYEEELKKKDPDYLGGTSEYVHGAEPAFAGLCRLTPTGYAIRSD